MKLRFAYLFSIAFLALVVLGSGLAGSLSFIPPGRASAAGSNSYIFYSPTDGSALKKSVDSQTESDGSFAQTAVYVKGGPFDKPFALKINVDRSGCAQASKFSLSGCESVSQSDNFGGQADDVYVYSGTYTCDANKGLIDSPGDSEYYTIDYDVSMKLGKTGADHALFDSSGKMKPTAKLHWVGFGSTDTAIQKTTANQGNGSGRVTSDVNIADVPSKCIPPGVPNSIRTAQHNDTQQNDKGIVNLDIPTYASNPSAAKSNWGDLNASAGVDGVGDATDSSAPGLTCNVTFNPITWLLCPAVKGLVSIVGDLDNVITSQLSVGSCGNSDQPTQIFGGTDPSCTNQSNASADAYHSAWSSVRDIALGLMVIAGLVVVISQALGMEILDAYTIRKVLPRILIAAVAITLSWQLMQFFVTFTNDLGYGIRFLIYKPFLGLGSSTLSGGGTVAAGLIGTGAILALGIVGLLSFAATAALAVFVAFLVLIIRQLLIIILIIFAPIAIVAYILPNTQKIYKIWWDSFAKALLMFPIIAAFIAAGRVFAVVAGVNSSNTLGQLMGFAAYFAPYFLLPLTFRFAGGALSGIGGFMNDRHRGAFDRLSKFRGRKIAENTAGMKNFSRFSDNNPIGSRANTLIGAAANPKSLLRGRRGVQASRKGRQSTWGASALKDNEIWNTNQGDDKFLLAVADRQLAEQKLGAAQRKFQTARASGDIEGMAQAQSEVDARQHAIDAAAQLGNLGKSRGVKMQALNSLAKTGFQFESGQAGYNELSDVAGRLAGGKDNGVYSAIMNEAQYNLRTAGRYDLGGINDGAGYQPRAGTDKASLYEIANGKAEGVDAMHEGITTTGAVGHPHAVLYKELEAMKPNAKGANRDKIVKMMSDLEARGIKEHMGRLSGVQETYTEQYDDDRARRDPVYASQWNAAQRTLGHKQRVVNLTNDQLAQKQARSYERPDPNRLT